MIKKGVVLFIALIFFINITSATLGITPFRKEIDYVPGTQRDIVFTIISDKPGQVVDIFVEGDLAEHTSVDKNQVVGAGSFTVTFNFPEKVDKPGWQYIGVRIKESVGESEFIGTAVEGIAQVKFFVPYPGKYIEASLNIPDVNEDEEIPVEVYVINRGLDRLFIDVDVLFLNDLGKSVNEIAFKPVELESNEDRYFRKYLNSTGMKPGRYDAVAEINYGEIMRVNQTVRIGGLYVNVTNYTAVLPKKGIQKFHVGIESKWNSKLEGVYADVNLSNSTTNMGFRTPSVDLSPWGRATLVGFIDTNNLEGEYIAEIILNYGNEKTRRRGYVSIVDSGISLIYYAFGFAGFLFLVLIIIVIIIIRKKAFTYPKIMKKNIKKKKEKIS